MLFNEPLIYTLVINVIQQDASFSVLFLTHWPHLKIKPTRLIVDNVNRFCCSLGLHAL